MPEYVASGPMTSRKKPEGWAPSAKRCAFVAFQEGGNRVIEDNLSHMEQSISAIKDRDEDRLADILHRYALQQCQQVLTAIEKTGSRTA